MTARLSVLRCCCRQNFMIVSNCRITVYLTYFVHSERVNWIPELVGGNIHTLSALAASHSCSLVFETYRPSIAMNKIYSKELSLEYNTKELYRSLLQAYQVNPDMSCWSARRFDQMDLPGRNRSAECHLEYYFIKKGIIVPKPGYDASRDWRECIEFRQIVTYIWWIRRSVFFYFWKLSMDPLNWLDHCRIAVKPNCVLVNHAHGERKPANKSDWPNYPAVLMNLLVDNIPWIKFSSMISKPFYLNPWGPTPSANFWKPVYTSSNLTSFKTSLLPWNTVFQIPH